METEEGGSTSASAAAAAGGNRPFAMKFSLSRPKRPSIHSHGQIGKQNDPQDAEIEYVSAVDEQGFVLTNPRSKTEPKVIPMMENTWRPEQRMKNLMVETLDLIEDRFVLETLTAGPKEGVRYGLSFGEKKTDLDSVEGFECDEKMADAKEARPPHQRRVSKRRPMAMETEEGGSTAASAAAAAGGNRPFAMKFSLSRPKRPSIHSHGQIGKQNDPQDAEIECVSGVDGQGFVLTNPTSKTEPKVIPKMENTWPPAKRMKNLMVETLDLDEDRFVLETLRLSLGEKKTDLDSVEGFESDEKMADAKEARPSAAEIEKRKLKEDVMLFPDEPPLDAYEEMPIEDFAEAMLRGMGWQKGKPIGRSAKAVVDPVQYVRRNGREGLGAAPLAPAENPKRYVKPGESRHSQLDLVAAVGKDGKTRNVISINEKLVERPKKGVHVGKVMTIIGGRHAGLRGEVIEEGKGGEGEVCVKLGKSRETVLVNVKDLADIGSLEEDKALKQLREMKLEFKERTGRADKSRSGRYDEEKEASGRREEKTFERKDETGKSEKRRDSRSKDHGRSPGRLEKERHSGRHGSKDSRKVDHVTEDHAKRSKEYSFPHRERGNSRNNESVEDKDHAKRDKDKGHESRRSERDYIESHDRLDDHGSREKSYATAKGGGESIKNTFSDPAIGKPIRPWLMSHIRVRIISKGFNGGKLYMKKARVVDVITPTVCDVLLDESGELIQEVKQEYLETALPKKGGRIAVVGGKHRGLLGKLLERNSEKEVALIQMEESFEMVTISMDSVAEFIGDSSDMH